MFNFSACSNTALPGESREPSEFDIYLDQANKAIIDSDLKVKEAEQILNESKNLLKEAQEIQKSILKTHAENLDTLKKIKSQRNAWEHRKRQEKKKAEELKKEIEEAEKAEPTPLPYSASDAPLNKE